MSHGRRRGSPSRHHALHAPAPPRSRWSGRRDTTRSGGVRWGSASSTMSPSRQRQPSAPSGGSRSSTGTSTTGTGRRRPSTGPTGSSTAPFTAGSTSPARTVRRTGRGEGIGYTLNAPLAAGSTGADYRYVFESIFCPAVAAFAPDLVLVSAGQDPLADDPLGGMALVPSDFGAMTHLLLEAAGRPAALVLEGGYGPRHGEAIAAILDALAGGDAPALRRAAPRHPAHRRVPGCRLAPARRSLARNHERERGYNRARQHQNRSGISGSVGRVNAEARLHGRWAGPNPWWRVWSGRSDPGTRGRLLSEMGPQGTGGTRGRRVVYPCVAFFGLFRKGIKYLQRDRAM